MPFQFTCEQCGSSFVRKQRANSGRPYRFCSRSCATDFRYPCSNSVSVINSDGFHRTVCTCKQCGNTFIKLKRGRICRPFCSRSCHFRNRDYRPDPIFNPDGTVLVPLSCHGNFAIIDTEDAERVLAFRWRDKRGYAAGYVPGDDGIMKHASLHRFVMDAKAGILIDHINGNKLDCRKSNLRPATEKQNGQYARKRSTNTSGFIGVQKRGKGWRAAIQIDLGRFDSPEEAARAYDAEAKRLRGEFAFLNFPDEEEVA